MGFFSQIAKNYRNAGARVSVFLYVVDTLEPRVPPDNPTGNFSCTGLELHDFAKAAKAGFLKILNADAAAYRTSIALPRDYWRLAMRVVVNELRKGLPASSADVVRDALCLTVESAFDTFTPGDILSVTLSRDGHVEVERLQNHPPFDTSRKRLGAITSAA